MDCVILPKFKQVHLTGAHLNQSQFNLDKEGSPRDRTPLSIPNRDKKLDHIKLLEMKTDRIISENYNKKNQYTLPTRIDFRRTRNPHHRSRSVPIQGIVLEKLDQGMVI